MLFSNISMVWCNLHNYSGFSKSNSGYYMLFMNYIVALVSIFKWLIAWKQGLSRPTFSCEDLSPSHSTIYHHQKAKKNFFAAQKSLRVLKLLRILTDRVVFRFSIDMIFLQRQGLLLVLSDRLFLRAAAIDPSLGSSVLFFRHGNIFLLNLATAFF